MKVLVAEDNSDIRAAMVMAIQGTATDIEVTQVEDGAQAIDAISNGSFDAVFCDYNMPEKTGGDVFLHLKKTTPKARFILVSSDSPEDHDEFSGHSVDYIEKPKIFKPIVKMISQLKGEVFQYFSIRLDLVKALQLKDVDLFLKLSDEKYVKVINGNSKHFESEIAGLEKKNLASVYISLKDASEVFQRLLEDTDRFFSSDATPQDHMNANEVIFQSIKVFGVTPEVKEMVEKSVQSAVDRIENCQQLSELIAGFSKGDYVTVHSTVLSHVAGYLCSMLPWSTAGDVERLALASLLHDLKVENSEIAKVQTRDEMDAFRDSFVPEEISNYYYHPVEAAKITKEFVGKELPEGVDMIVLQHHERPDGSGFPKKIKASEIEPLSGVFIVAHEIATKMRPGNDEKEAVQVLLGVSQSFSGGVFDGINQALQEKFSELIR